MNSAEQASMVFKPSLLHIDVARNATDDFNLFHDKQRWQEINGNPFEGPIALGFQTEGFIEHQCKLMRLQQGEDKVIEENRLRFSHYQLNFVSVIKPDQAVYLEVRKTKIQNSETGPVLKNRLLMKSEQGLVISGAKSESSTALFGNTLDIKMLPELRNVEDRSWLKQPNLFYKRKFTTNCNAKNYLLSAGVEQSFYFDELAERISFPESYCTALLSCALLEQAKSTGHNLVTHPMVYTSHKLSVDRERVQALRSDSMLHFLVAPPDIDESTQLSHYQCYILDASQSLLCQGILTLAPLSVVTANSQ